MELGLNVNAGPLNQIGVQVLSLDIAYHLAVNAYGWWKARERSVSLIELVKLKGGALVSSNSFRRDTYIEYRKQRGDFRGVVVQQGHVQSASMPEASTATEGGPGQLCLRALTAGLLCHFEPAATVLILQELIPSELLNLDLEGKEVEIDGPLLASLQQYVASVATEEDNDNYRKSVLKTVNELQFRVSGLSAAELMALEPTRHDGADAHLVIGFLKWMLQAAYKREPVHYPTRSLRVWTVAATMSLFGFEVSASTEAITSKQQYQTFFATTSTSITLAEVLLVTAQAGPTDQLKTHEYSPLGVSQGLRHQIVPLRAIPWTAFRHYRGRKGKKSTDYLSDVWMSAFEEAKSSVTGIGLSLKGHCSIEVNRNASTANLRFYKGLLRIFSPQLGRVCGKTMEQFVPQVEDDDQWNLDKISQQMQTIGRSTEGQGERKDIELQTGTLVFISITLGTIYGLACCTAYDIQEEPLNLDSEIAFMPDLIYDPDIIRGWATSFGLVLDGSLQHTHCINICHELFIGVKFTPGTLDIDRQETTTSGGRNTTLILGGQANGIAIISDVIVHPFRSADGVVRFHISRGQILSFPIDDDGLIRSAKYLRTPITQTFIPNTTMESLVPDDLVEHELSSRLDIEPCWEAEPNSVVFRARNHGITIVSSNIEVTIKILMEKRAGCSCNQYSADLSIFSTGAWGHIEVAQIVTVSNKNNELIINSRSENEQILIDCRKSYAFLIACIGNIGLRYRNITIADKCYKCALDRANEYKGRKAILLARARVQHELE